ncbi:TPA: hypothetical protein I3599_001348 [Enterobacter cloacae]|nr:hypothetical protein [Enterobacter cloacae]
MSTISKERVKDILEFGAGRIISPITDYEIMELARIALASLEAEAVAYVMADDLKDSSIISTPAYRDLGEAMERTVGDVVALFTAPPAPVSVPDDVTAEDCPALIKYDLTEVDEAWARGFNACRDAMLQGADGNSPVIPDGWVMVPKEPTPEMINSAMRDNETGEVAEIYELMLAAAPQQEVKP